MSSSPIANANHHTNNDNQHRIHITNYQANECIKYATVLLKGTVSDCCLTTGDSLCVRVRGYPESFPCTDIKRNRDGMGSFKCLLDLCPGENVIRVDYCNSSTTICLVYDDSLATSQCCPIVKVYNVVCQGHNGCFQNHGSNDSTAEIACDKINVGIRLIQCLIAEKLYEAGFARKTFQFIACQPFHSAMTVEEARNWHTGQIWNFLAREFIASDNCSKNVKYVGLLACTLYTGLGEDFAYSDRAVKANTRAHIALGAGDVALYGTGCLYTWPSSIRHAIECFDSKQAVAIDHQMDDSNGRRTYGGCFATTLGSLCHEMGHIFDLGHTIDGIMGNGFDFVNRVFTHEAATVLLPRRFVNPCQQMDAPATTIQPSRFTQLKRSNRFLTEYQQQRNNDLTYFCDNSNVMLFYHKWLNSKKATSTPHTIAFDRQNGIVVARLPLRLIELRDRRCALTIHYAAYTREKVFTYQLPAEFATSSSNIYDVLVLDDDGNIAKFSE